MSFPNTLEEEIDRLKTLNEALNASLLEAQRVNGGLLAALVELVDADEHEELVDSMFKRARAAIAATRSQS